MFIRIVPSSRLAIPKLVAANFPFDPPILVEVVNNRSERITTGSNSALVRATYLIPFTLPKILVLMGRHNLVMVL